MRTNPSGCDSRRLHRLSRLPDVSYSCSSTWTSSFPVEQASRRIRATVCRTITKCPDNQHLVSPQEHNLQHNTFWCGCYRLVSSRPVYNPRCSYSRPPAPDLARTTSTARTHAWPHGLHAVEPRAATDGPAQIVQSVRVPQHPCG